MTTFCYLAILTIYLTYAYGISVHKFTKIYKTEEFYYGGSLQISTSNEINEEDTIDIDDASIAEAKLPLRSCLQSNSGPKSSNDTINNLKFSVKKQTVDDANPEIDWKRKQNHTLPSKSPDTSCDNFDFEASEFTKQEMDQNKNHNHESAINASEFLHNYKVNTDFKNPLQTSNGEGDSETNLYKQPLDDHYIHAKRHYLESRTGHRKNNVATTLPLNNLSDARQVNIENDSYDNIIINRGEMEDQQNDKLHLNFDNKIVASSAATENNQEIPNTNQRESVTTTEKMEDIAQVKLDKSPDYLIKPIVFSDKVNPSLIKNKTQQYVSPPIIIIHGDEYTDKDWKKLTNILQFILTKHPTNGKGTYNMTNKFKKEAPKELLYVSDRKDIYKKPRDMVQSIGNPVNESLKVISSKMDIIQKDSNKNNEVTTGPLGEKRPTLAIVVKKRQNGSGLKNPVTSEEEGKNENEEDAKRSSKDNTKEISNLLTINNKSRLMVPVKFIEEDESDCDAEENQESKSCKDVRSDIINLYSRTRSRIQPVSDKPIMLDENNLNSNSKEDINTLRNQENISGTTITTHATEFINPLPPYEENLHEDMVGETKSGQSKEDNEVSILYFPTESKSKPHKVIHRNIPSVEENIIYNSSKYNATSQPNEEILSAISTPNSINKLRISDVDDVSEKWRIQSENKFSENTKEYIILLPSEDNTSIIKIKAHNAGSKNHIPSDEEDQSDFRWEENNGQVHSLTKSLIPRPKKPILANETDSNENTKEDRNFMQL